MADTLSRGYHDARDAGMFADGMVIRLALAMVAMTTEEITDAIHVEDTNLSAEEYDGTGYGQHVAAAVTWQWSDADDEMRLDCDSDTEAFGTTVDAASTAPVGMWAIAQVGGSPDDAVDYVIGWNDSGSYGNGTGLAYGLTVPDGGFFFSGGA